MPAQLCVICHRIMAKQSWCAFCAALVGLPLLTHRYCLSCGHQAHLACWHNTLQELHQDIDGQKAVDCPGQHPGGEVVHVFEKDVPPLDKADAE